MIKDITMIVCNNDSSIECFGYNSKKKELHVISKNKTHCVYSNVPKDKFQFMACSDSRAIYFAKNIMKNFKSDIVV